MWILSYKNANITDETKKAFWPPTQIRVSSLRSDYCQTFLFTYLQSRRKFGSYYINRLTVFNLITALWWSLDLLRENRTNFQKSGHFSTFHTSSFCLSLYFFLSIFYHSFLSFARTEIVSPSQWRVRLWDLRAV